MDFGLELRLVLEHFGVCVSAITGVLAARKKDIDLFGIIVLAMVTAFGGGTIRDIVIGRAPVFWVQDSSYAMNAFITALAAFLLFRYAKPPHNLLQIFDAFALALFSTIGVQKALLSGTDSFIALIMGVITGVAGGMLRDVLTGEIPLVFRQNVYLYATAAFVGGIAFVVLYPLVPRPIPTVVSVCSILVLRLIGIRWKISLPLFRSRD